MTEKQIRRIIARVFAANGSALDADDVKLEFRVRMPGAAARAGYGGYIPALGKFVVASPRPMGLATTPTIQFSGAHFEGETAKVQREIVAHEACHLVAGDTHGDGHGTEWAAAMERAGYGDHVVAHRALLDHNAKVSAENREASYQARLKREREHRKTPEHKAELAARRDRRAQRLKQEAVLEAERVRKANRLWSRAARWLQRLFN